MGILWRDALADDAFRITCPLVRNEGHTGDWPVPLQVELARLANLARGENLLRPGLLSDIRRAFDQSPWVARTYPFRRDLKDCRVLTDFEVRLPAVQVVSQGFYYLLDKNGVLLSAEGAARPDAGLPVVRCSLSERPPEGVAWNSQELMSALGVLGVLRRSVVAQDLPLREIRVEGRWFYDTALRERMLRPAITLFTESGAVIRWGAFNAEKDLSEPLPEEKVEELRRVLCRGPGLSQGDVLDIRTRSVFFSTRPVTLR
ncbi:MAG: hypothetical protein V1918_01410 [Planctomycetota bacterium]